MSRNVQPFGNLVIADAKLTLAPGEVVEVKEPTPQTQSALERGFVEEVSEGTPVGAPEAPEPTPAVPASYERLSAAEAIEFIDDEDDPAALQAILGAEKRKTVLEALNRKLEEAGAGGAEAGGGGLL